MIIGVDESGTGALAGPFVVCACAFVSPPPLGLRDSKKLTPRARFEFTAQLLSGPAVLGIEIVTPKDIRARGHQRCWEDAVLRVASRVAKHLLTSATPPTTVEVLVDGNGSAALRSAFFAAGLRVTFEPKADDTYPEVSAASIVAKTERTLWMEELHRRYPEYEWNRNAGYGTPHHLAEIKRRGTTTEHRPCDLKKP